MGEKSGFFIHNIVMFDRVDGELVSARVVFSTSDLGCAEKFLFTANIVDAECELQTTPVYL